MKSNSSVESYDIRVIDKHTKQSRKIEVNAKSYDDARIQALTEGNVLDIRRKKSFLTKFSFKFNAEQRITFLGDLGTMLKSGVGSTESLSKLAETHSGVMKKVALLLKSRVEAGDDLPTAMQSLGPRVFPDTIVYFIKAGSVGGNTGDAILDATDFEREIEQLKKKSVFDLVVSIVVFALAVALVVASIFIIPPLIHNAPMLQDSGFKNESVDLASQLLGYAMLVFVGVCFVFVSLNTYLKLIFPYAADKLLLKIPFFKDIVSAKNSFISFYSLSKLLSSGVRVEDALRVTMENTKKGVLKSDFNKAHKAIKRGDSKWPKYISSLRPTDKACLLISTSREHMAEVLNSVSTLYRQRYIDRIGKLVSSLQLISAFFMIIAMLVIYKQTTSPLLHVINTPI